MITMLLLIVGALALCLAVFCVGYLVGFNNRMFMDRLKSLEEERAERKAEEEDVSAIVDTSPKRMAERQAMRTPEQESEAQIIRTKTPQQMRADRERKDKEELDRLTNGAIR